MTNIDYPSNSNKVKESDKKPEKQINKVTLSQARIGKAPLGVRLKETFVGGDVEEVRSYVFFEVVVPAIKSMLFDTVVASADQMLFGNGPRSGTLKAAANTIAGRIDYNKTSTQRSKGGRVEQRPTITSRDRSQHNFDSVILETRGEAAGLLEEMERVISDYGWVSVSDFYEMVDITGEFTDEKWGWHSVDGAVVRPARGGYTVVLPKPVFDD